MHGAPRSANVWLGLFAFNIITFIIFLFQFYSDRKSRLGLNSTGQQSQQQIETSFQQQNNETACFYPSQDKYQSYRSLQDAGEAETSALLKWMPFDSVIIWIKPKRRSATIGSHSALLCGRVGGSHIQCFFLFFMFTLHLDSASSELSHLLTLLIVKAPSTLKCCQLCLPRIDVKKKKSKVKIE